MQSSRQELSVRCPKPPERPLPPYMRFSRKIWPKVRGENPDSQLWEISRMVGQLWNELPEAEKTIYQEEFESERIDYEKHMKSYQQSYSQYLSMKSKSLKNIIEKGTMGATLSRKGGVPDQNSLSGVVIQPVDEEDPFEMTSRKLSAIRYDRNNRLMLELFSPNCLPDQRTIIPQYRIEQLKKQCSSLGEHQTRLNEELSKLEDNFNQRKRSILSSTESFNESLKRICERKPNFDQENYEKMVNEAMEEITKNYEEHKRKLQIKLETEKKETPILSSLIEQASANCANGEGNDVDAVDK